MHAYLYIDIKLYIAILNMSCGAFVEPLSLTGAIVSGNTQGHFGDGKNTKVRIKAILCQGVKVMEIF